MFNYQQFSRLAARNDVTILVPVILWQWLKYAGMRNSLKQDNVRYTWYVNVPGTFRSGYGILMFLCLLLNSGLWLVKQRFTKLLASWAYPEGQAGQYLAFWFRVPFYLKVHGSDINVLADKGLRKAIISRSCSRARAVISVSQALKRKIYQLTDGEANVKVIYNGVNHELFQLEEQKANKILYIGNLKAEKGVYELLEAYSQLTPETRPKLVIAGGGPELQNLADRVQQYQLSEDVLLPGPVKHEEVPELLSTARLLVLPSYHEGVPNVVLEAFACGTPVVATSVGGIPEIVEAGKTGFLCAPRDSRGLLEAIRKALDHNWDYKVIKEHSRTFDWDKNIALLQAALELGKNCRKEAAH